MQPPRLPVVYSEVKERHEGAHEVYFDKGSDVPNSQLPVLIYRGIFAPQITGKAARFRQAFKQKTWTGLWTDTIYDYTHFHSNAHEVLGIAAAKSP